MAIASAPSLPDWQAAFRLLERAVKFEYENGYPDPNLTGKAKDALSKVLGNSQTLAGEQRYLLELWMENELSKIN